MGDDSDWPPRFGVDESNVLELFTGDRFYSSSDAALREAILNSIDACGRRKALEGDGYERAIEVVFDRDALTITVRDNGDGMNKDQVSNLFTEVGATAADLAVQMEAENYQAVGEFGIGVVSYFLVCEEYELHTVGDSGNPIGILISNQMLDAETDAEEITPRREQRGTTLVFPISDAEVFDRLLDRFPHWVRDVEYLEARRMPSREQVEQGGLTSDIHPIQPEELPGWVEKIHLGPPTKFDRWYHLDGNGDVDLLYRGVFVDNIKPSNLWGLEGAIHVDPKKFEPKLNREGFIGDKDQETIVRFLKNIHPYALQKALRCIKDIDFSSQTRWNKLRWVNLWLAIPRNNNYKKVYTSWDAAFRDLEVFKLLLPNNSSKSVSVADISDLEVDKVYLAPPNLNQIDDLGRQAVRVLRARGVPVVQSTERESSFLKRASYIGNSSNDILKYFSNELPSLVKIIDEKEIIVRKDYDEYIFSNNPKVLVVSLGSEGDSLVCVEGEVWINVDDDDGKRIIEAICARNEGYTGLWISCLEFAPEKTNKLASVLRGSIGKERHLGIVKRQHLRRLIE